MDSELCIVEVAKYKTDCPLAVYLRWLQHILVLGVLFDKAFTPLVPQHLDPAAFASICCFDLQARADMFSSNMQEQINSVLISSCNHSIWLLVSVRPNRHYLGCCWRCSLWKVREVVHSWACTRMNIEHCKRCITLTHSCAQCTMHNLAKKWKVPICWPKICVSDDEWIAVLSHFSRRYSYPRTDTVGFIDIYWALEEIDRVQSWLEHLWLVNDMASWWLLNLTRWRDCCMHEPDVNEELNTPVNVWANRLQQHKEAIKSPFDTVRQKSWLRDIVVQNVSIGRFTISLHISQTIWPCVIQAPWPLFVIRILDVSSRMCNLFPSRQVFLKSHVICTFCLSKQALLRRPCSAARRQL